MIRSIKKKEKFSYSRVSTFNDCPLKYKYRYADKVYAEGIDNQAAAKGTVFHNMAEMYNFEKDTRESCLKMIAKEAKQLNVNPADYPYEEGVDRWLAYQRDFVQTKLAAGFSEKREEWINGIVDNESFTGAIDNILVSKDKIIIVDYKSGKSVSTSGYRKQLLTYAYYKGKTLFPVKELAERVELYVFFPLGDVKGKTIEERAEKSLVQVLYTQEELEENFSTLTKDVSDIKKTDWANISTSQARTSYMCRFCDYQGAVKSDIFEGCPKSYSEGLRQKRTTKFYKK